MIQDRTVNSQIASSIIQETQYNIDHAGIKGYEKTGCRMKETEDTGYRIEEILRSLVAPLKMGRRMTGSAVTAKDVAWGRGAKIGLGFGEGSR